MVVVMTPLTLCSTDLLGLLDGPLSLTSTTTATSAAPEAPPPSNILAPYLSTDISLLNPSSGQQVQLAEPQESLALTLFENPIGSARVPSQYSSHPVVPGWENKVRSVHSSSFEGNCSLYSL